MEPSHTPASCISAGRQGASRTTDLLPCTTHLIDEGVDCVPVHIFAEAQACAEDEGFVDSDEGGVNVGLLTVACRQGRRTLSRCHQGPCWQLPAKSIVAAQCQLEVAGSPSSADPCWCHVAGSRTAAAGAQQTVHQAVCTAPAYRAKQIS